MPTRIEKVSPRCWRVLGPRGRVHAECTTKKMAQAQMNLLQGIEHGWTPSKKGGKIKAKDEEVEGKIEVIDEQPIFIHEDKKEDDTSSEEEEEVSGGKIKKAKKKTKKTTAPKKKTTGGSVGSWKDYVKTHMAGKKFAKREEANEFLKSLAKEFKATKGAGVEEILLRKDLGTAKQSISVPGPGLDKQKL